MRKAYGPSGISYVLPFTKFLQDVRDGETYQVCTDIDGMTLTRDKARSIQHWPEEQLRQLYRQVDCLTQDSNGAKTLHVVIT